MVLENDGSRPQSQFQEIAFWIRLYSLNVVIHDLRVFLDMFKTLQGTLREKCYLRTSEL